MCKRVLRGGKLAGIPQLCADTGVAACRVQVALAALVSLVMVVVGAIVFGYRRWAGLDRPYTVVTKQGDV